MPETGDWKGESKGVRSLREAVHQFGMFLQRVDHSQKISIQTAGARPRTLDVRSETKKAGQGLCHSEDQRDEAERPPTGGNLGQKQILRSAQDDSRGKGVNGKR